MKDFKHNDIVWFMYKGEILEKYIESKTEKVDGWNHKTINVSYTALSSRTVLNPIVYDLRPDQIFKTKEELLCNFIKENA